MFVSRYLPSQQLRIPSPMYRSLEGGLGGTSLLKRGSPQSDPPADSPRPKPPPQHLPFLTLVLLLLMAFYAFHGPIRARLSGRHRAEATFERALELVLDEYVDERSPGELTREAVKGMVESLGDRHSAFLSPVSNRRQSEDESGQYAGLGITIRLYERKVLVQEIFAGAPAMKAGLKVGDFIVAADGRDLTNLDSLEQTFGSLRGPRGSTVTLGVLRGGQRLEIAVTRDVIKRPFVEYKMLGPQVGYVWLHDFPDDAATHLTKAIEALQGKGAKGLLLDLRRNQGGFLDEAVRVADLFLATGRIVSTRSRHPSDNHTYDAKAGGPAESIPLVVLVNEGSASAAEVVAGALQDHGRAALVGATTYGKGAVNKRFPLPDGSGVLLTTGRYFLPKGRQIEKVGLKPDVAVAAPSKEVMDAVLPGTLAPDPQRDAALELLRRRLDAQANAEGTAVR